MLLTNKSKSFPQNIWGKTDQRQRRRAELVRFLVEKRRAGMILDVGCAEGYITKFITDSGSRPIGIDLDLGNLILAKQKAGSADFVNASMEYIPFRNNSFDAITILEVLEHLPSDLQELGLKETSRSLKPNGTLLISIPYNEKIIKTKCVHCGEITPLYGHLHSMDENYIITILGKYSKFVLKDVYRLPNVQIISCKDILRPLPFRLWMLFNNLLGLIRKGYWIVLYFTKEDI